MNRDILDRLDRHISTRSLLTHPFYQDWKDGALTLEDLRLYAAQYYHFEASFPRFLSTVHSRCTDQKVRQSILSNLWDEEHGEQNHRAQWLGFCEGLGLTPESVEQTPVQPKTGALLDTYSSACSASFQEGIAAIYAYEAQVPQIASEKLQGLRNQYGIEDEDTLAFFQVHSHLDKEHSRLEAEAISMHTSVNEEPAVESALWAALDTWWGFLDGVNELRAGRL